MPALAPTDLLSVRTMAEEWTTKNPLAHVLHLPRRIYDKGARAAYIMVRSSTPSQAPGEEPCSVCGEISSSFCETCPLDSVENPPFAVCRDCDQDGMVCPHCRDDGAPWEKEKLKHIPAHQGECIEVSGVALDDGTFKRFPTTLRIPTGDVQLPLLRGKGTMLIFARGYLPNHLGDH